MRYFFELIQVALGEREKLSGIPADKEWEALYQEAEKQAVVGLTLIGLDCLPECQRPPQEVLLQWIGEGEMIRQQNAVMNDAVIRLYMSLNAVGVKTFVFKGQTLAHLYSDSGLRQSGDIDFYCHQDDWEKSIRWLKETWGVEPNILSSQKDAEFNYEGVAYEMHRKLALFNYPKHALYWENVVMKEVLSQPYSVVINGYDVPTLAPVYNVLYVFVHIFQHLISDGIGLRQFVDWMLLINNLKWEKYEVELLERHLKCLGLKDAFVGLGAVLIDYLGLPEDKFPFQVSEDAHKQAPLLVENIMQMGNFGQNLHYTQSEGMVHGIQHMGRILKQVRLFGHYAPLESWWKVPFMIKWWGKKLLMMAKIGRQS